MIPNPTTPTKRFEGKHQHPWEPIVHLKLSGGLGNQLFMYSAAMAISRRNGVPLVVDDVTAYANDSGYSRKSMLHHFSIDISREAWPSYMGKKQGLSFRRIVRFICPRDYIYLGYFQHSFNKEISHFNVKKRLFIEGYFQSEKYFDSFSQEVKNHLAIIPPNDRVNSLICSEILSCLAVAVHIRFFCASSSTNSINAPASYYSRAISFVQNLVPDARFFVFSDRPDLVGSVLDPLKINYRLMTQNLSDELSYADLWLMSQCKHFIIANSTFSWWGAWLSRNESKIVVAPRVNAKLGDGWCSSDLLPNAWVQL